MNNIGNEVKEQFANPVQQSDAQKCTCDESTGFGRRMRTGLYIGKSAIFTSYGFTPEAAASFLCQEQTN
jgi:hypothetical protein